MKTLVKIPLSDWSGLRFEVPIAPGNLHSGAIKVWFWPKAVASKVSFGKVYAMNIEDTIGYQNDAPVCVVCGKNVQGDRGFSRINHQGTMVNLCCPLCLKTFQNDPFPHMARLTKVELFRDLNKPAK